MRALGILGLGAAITSAAFASSYAQDDASDSKDHLLLSRMPGYFISEYQQRDFDSFEFPAKDGAKVTLEGRKTMIGYRPKEGVTVASPLQIARNYHNALTRIGGVVLHQDVGPGGGQTSMKLVREPEEIWVEVRIGDSGNSYNVNVIEKSGMQQDVVANADAWKSDINSTGHAAVYGITFDTDKAAIKPESEPALQEIEKLLAQNPTLTVLLVGHTDSTGEILHNMTLSEARAKAVVAALTAKHGIAASRLSAYGCGPLAPVASNDSDGGRAKNRRVELVKR